MIGTIRKHSKILWWIIIVVIVVTFVYWGSQTSQPGGGGGGSGDLGRMNGEPITPKKYEDAKREVYLGYFFKSGGSWPNQGRAVSGFDVERVVFLKINVTDPNGKLVFK